MSRRARRFEIAPVVSAGENDRAAWDYVRVIDADPVDDCPLCGWPLVPVPVEYRVCRCELGALLLRGAS